MAKKTGIKNKTDNISTDNNTDIEKITDKPLNKTRKTNKSVSPKTSRPAKKKAAPPAPAPEEIPTPSQKTVYERTDFISVQAMASLKGFAPLGMLFVLMDVLNGGDEGLIRINRLASALSIGKPAILAQLDNLEKAGLVRTVSSSQRGRHIELLVPNYVVSKTIPDGEALPFEEPTATIDSVPSGMPSTFSLEKLKDLQRYLSDRGIRVTYLPDESGLDPHLSEIASFLGKYLNYVQPFYSRLKTTLNEGQEVEFSLIGFQGREITHTLNFCRMLHEAGILGEFVYKRAPHYKIITRVDRTPKAINFLSGGWLEHYIRDKVLSILTLHPATHDTPFAFMKNPRILLPGDEDFEFDFLLMVGEKVFWIEAKTGEYLDFMSKYARVSKLLGLKQNNAFLVLVESPKADEKFSQRYGLTCCDVGEFPEVFRLNMLRELASSGEKSLKEKNRPKRQRAPAKGQGNSG